MSLPKDKILANLLQKGAYREIVQKLDENLLEIKDRWILIESYIALGENKKAETQLDLKKNELSSSFDKSLWNYYMGQFFLSKSHYEKALSFFNINSDTLNMNSVHESNLQINMSIEIGICYWRLGSYNTSLERLTESVDALKQQDLNERNIRYEDTLAKALHYLGSVSWHIGKIEQAIIYLKSSLLIREEQENIQSTAVTLNNLGLIYKNQGNYQLSLDSNVKSLILREKVGVKKDIGDALCNVSLLYEDLGDYQQSLEFSKRGLEVYSETGFTEGIAEISFNLGRVEAKIGTLSLNSDAFRQFPDNDDNFTLVDTYRTLLNGYLLKQNQEHQRAINCFQEALQMKALVFEYQILCYEALTEIYIQTLDIKQLSLILDQWEAICVLNKLFPSLCKNYIIRAKLYILFKDFTGGEEYLTKCLSLSLQYQLENYHKLAKTELEKFQKLKKIEQQLQAEDKDQKQIDESQITDIKSYLTKIFQYLGN